MAVTPENARRIVNALYEVFYPQRLSDGVLIPDDLDGKWELYEQRRRAACVEDDVDRKWALMRDARVLFMEWNAQNGGLPCSWRLCCDDVELPRAGLTD